MKLTFIETFVDGKKLLGSDFTTVVRDRDTRKKLDNSINAHIKKLNSLKEIKPILKGNYTIKYESVYG